MRIKSIRFLFCLLVLGVFAAGTLPVSAAGCAPADLSCVQIDSLGTVTLNWVNAPADANISNTYIYVSNSYSGPYVLLDSVAGNLSSSFIDPINNAYTAANNSLFYFVKTGCSAGLTNAVASDTIAAIILNLSKTVAGNAMLSWNSISHSTANSVYYSIYREYPTGTWTFVDSTTSLTYIDTISVCTPKLPIHYNYKVQVQNKQSCLSNSTWTGGSFFNLNVPPSPVLDSVSVIAGGEVQLGWEPSTDKWTTKYLIYKYQNGGWQIIDSVQGRANTSFVNTNSSANSQAEYYCIAVRDNCSTSLLAPLDPVNRNILGSCTIFITGKPNPCERKMTLTWNSYQNMLSKVKSYEVFYSVNGGPFVLLTNNPADSLSAVHENLIQGATYTYKIIARDNSGTRSSSSALYTYLAQQPPEPKFSYLATASVISSSQTYIASEVDVNAEIKYYKVMRSQSPQGPFDSIGTIKFNNQPLVFFIDSTPAPAAFIYYYKTIAVDTCNDDTTQTQVAHTILLNALAQNNAINQITWNDYEQWLGGVKQYLLFRAIDSVWSNVPIATIPFTAAGTNQYNDNVSNFYNQKGVFSYRVEAFEGPGNTYNIADSSWSNVANAYQGDIFYIPTAFVPTGVNKVFLPITNYVDPLEYDFRIFDRWGTQVFATTSLQQGWDGKFHGTYCEQGVYVYFIRYKAADGQYLERKGAVALLK